jgi:hypothetical protein
MRRKKKTITLTIKPGKVALGHQSHVSGSGAHDSRPHRQRTRQAQKESWKRDELN